jgi:hypothetical protein
MGPHEREGITKAELVRRVRKQLQNDPEYRTRFGSEEESISRNTILAAAKEQGLQFTSDRLSI